MASYPKMLEKLEEASELITSAEECMLPAETMKLMDSYLIGYLRCCKLVIAEASKAIKESSQYKENKKKQRSEE